MIFSLPIITALLSSIKLLCLSDAQALSVGPDDTQSVGVAHAALPALDDNNGLTLGQDTQLHGLCHTPLDAAIDILLPVDLAKVGLGLGEQEGINAPVQVSVPGSRGVSCDHENGADGSVFGQETGRISRGRQNNDSASVQIQRCADSRHGAGLDNADRSLNEAAHLLEVGNIGNDILRLQASLGHLPNGLVRVATLGRLTRKHDAVGAISHSVTNIADLGTSRSGVLDHRLKHLGRANNGLSSHVTHGNQLLLSRKDLSGRDLNSELQNMSVRP